VLYQAASASQAFRLGSEKQIFRPIPIGLALLMSARIVAGDRFCRRDSNPAAISHIDLVYWSF
jgi:hypothetical protein